MTQSTKQCQAGVSSVSLHLGKLRLKDLTTVRGSWRQSLDLNPDPLSYNAQVLNSFKAKVVPGVD